MDVPSLTVSLVDFTIIVLVITMEVYGAGENLNPKRYVQVAVYGV